MVENCPYGSNPRDGADIEAGVLTTGSLNLRGNFGPIRPASGGVEIDTVELARRVTGTNREISLVYVWFEDIITFCQKPPPLPDEIPAVQGLAEGFQAYASLILNQRWRENCQCNLPENARDEECAYWAKKGQCEGSLYQIYTDLDIRIYGENEGSVIADEVLEFPFVNQAYGPLGVPYFIDANIPNKNLKVLAVKQWEGTPNEQEIVLTPGIPFYVRTGSDPREGLPEGVSYFLETIFVGTASYCVSLEGRDDCCGRPQTPEYPVRDTSADYILELEEEEVTIIFIPIEGPPGPPGPEGPKGDPGNPQTIITNLARVGTDTPESFTATPNFFGDEITLNLALHTQPVIPTIRMLLQRVPPNESARVIKQTEGNEITFTLFLPHPPTVITALSLFNDPEEDPSFSAETELGVTTLRLKLYREMLKPLVEEILDLLKAQETVEMRITDCEGNQLAQNVTAPRIVAIAKAIGISSNLSDTRDQRMCDEQSDLMKVLTDPETIEMRTTDCNGSQLSQNVTAPRLVAIAKAIGISSNLSDTRDQRMCDEQSDLMKVLTDPETIEMRTTDCNGSQLSQNVTAPRLVAIAKAIGISSNLSDTRDQRMCQIEEVVNLVNNLPSEAEIKNLLFLQTSAEITAIGGLFTAMAQLQFGLIANAVVILAGFMGYANLNVVIPIFAPGVGNVPLFDRALEILDLINSILNLINNLRDLFSGGNNGEENLDIQAILDKLEELKKLLNDPETIEMRTTDCEDNQTPQNVTAPRIVAIAKAIGIAQNLSDQRDKRMCDADSYAAVPEWWQIRPEGDRPQLVIQFAEQIEEGKFGPPKYALTIPHYPDIIPTSSPVGSYEKGSFMGILTLNDNSKVIVNCKTQEECDRVLAEAKSVIATSQTSNSFEKIGERKGNPLQQKRLYPRIAKYFPTGQQDTKPKWVKYFYER